MNGFTRWLEKNRRGSDEKKHKTALSIALSLTLIVAYFVAYSWYVKFTSALNPQIENSVESVEQLKQETYLEKIKSSFKNVFDNTQSVSR
jgi:uncharacterized protein YpmB